MGSLDGVALTILCALRSCGCCMFVMGRFPPSGRLPVAPDWELAGAEQVYLKWWG